MASDQLPQKLRELFSNAYHNVYSSFYRDVYAKKGFVLKTDTLTTMSDWRSVPYISKEDLAPYSYKERVFLPLQEEDILYFHTSSGTSKSPVVLNLRNTHFRTDLRALKKYADRLLWASGSPTSMYDFYAGGNIASTGGSLSDLPKTARGAAHFRIQGIHATPSQLTALTPHLEAEMDLLEIRALILWGERFSTATYGFIKQKYPNAIIFPMFGNAETQGFHTVPCEALARTGRNYVHFFEESVFPELIDTESLQVLDKANQDGELVITVLWERNIFPVVRFRTGDLAQRLSERCSCGRETYELLGRSGFDRLTVPGGQLRSDEIERVLDSFRDLIEDDYSVHVFDVPTEGTVRTRMELHVRPIHATVDLDAIAKQVSKELWLGPQQTIDSGVQRGLYEPLVCKKIVDTRNPGAKKTRIIRHT